MRKKVYVFDDTACFAKLSFRAVTDTAHHMLAQFSVSHVTPPSPQPTMDMTNIETESAFGADVNDDMSTLMSDDMVAPEERLKQLGIKLPTPSEQLWTKCV